MLCKMLVLLFLLSLCKFFQSFGFGSFELHFFIPFHASLDLDSVEFWFLDFILCSVLLVLLDKYSELNLCLGALHSCFLLNTDVWERTVDRVRKRVRVGDEMGKKNLIGGKLHRVRTRPLGICAPYYKLLR